ncbi:MAG: hemolysin XhlA family protein [Helicobacteraceae bacterium]|jgi:hypothetical protein|nr:hemolysin XhlA family protein [Helicobacteraceae bacterium]
MNNGRRRDDTKIDLLIDEVKQIRISQARQEEQMKAFADKHDDLKDDIKSLQGNQRKAAWAIVGAFIAAIANFIWQGTSK